MDKTGNTSKTQKKHMMEKQSPRLRGWPLAPA